MPYLDPEQKRLNQQRYNARPEVRAKRRAYYEKFQETHRPHLLSREAERRIKKRAQCLVSGARLRAEKKGLPFDLDDHVDDLQRRIDLGVCELTGYPFDLSPGRPFNCPSLDRIVPCLGYTYGNVRIVLNLVNSALSDWGEDTLREVMSKWLQPTS